MFLKSSLDHPGKAQSLKQDKPLRNLQDLFYDSQPEELPWILSSSVTQPCTLLGLGFK